MKIEKFAVEDWQNQYENDALYNIASVSIASLSLEELLALGGSDQTHFLADMAKRPLNYGWIEGSPAFKEEVAKLYSPLTADQVLQTNGATGANFLVLYSLIEPGDHVISLYPTYQQLYDIPKSFGAEVDLWEAKEELGWLPDLENLRQLVRPDTKMICLNNANNPTGAVMDKAFLEEVVAIAKSCGAYILSDEVYHNFIGEPITPIVTLYDKGISVNSLSKTYSLPGIRVGWVVASTAIIDQLRGYRDYTMICAGGFDDLIATYALQHKEAILARNQQLVKTNLAILEAWLQDEPKASAQLPAGVSTAFVKLDITGDVETFCLRLLQETGVFLVPGTCFDREGYVRLGYCCSEATLRTALEKLSHFLNNYTKTS